MNPILERRLRQFRGRQQIRAWDYRQRDLARGVWFRLRRALAGAAEIYSVPKQVATQLIAEGAATASVGRELELPKEIAVVPADWAARIVGGRRLEPALSAELLTSAALVLVPFQPGSIAASPPDKPVPELT